jgi:RNA polymerase-binding protein
VSGRTWPLQGHTPRQGSATAEIPYERLAHRQLAPYLCTRGHRFEVTFAAGVEAPAAWECRCGAPAAAADAGHDGGAGGEHSRHVGTVFGRRTEAEREQLLADRLGQVRGT